jgi:hypothetical protein
MARSGANVGPMIAAPMSETDEINEERADDQRDVGGAGVGGEVVMPVGGEAVNDIAVPSFAATCGQSRLRPEPEAERPSDDRRADQWRPG